MTGRQLPLLSLFVPFWLVFMMDGLRGVRETWPAALVAGLSFAVTQYFTSNFIGPDLPDITSALARLISRMLAGQRNLVGASMMKAWSLYRSRLDPTEVLRNPIGSVPILKPLGAGWISRQHFPAHWFRWVRRP